MLQYLSNEIRHKFIMEAVLKRTSMAECTSHHHAPNSQYPINSFASENGMMIKPRKKSATASDAMNQFWMFFKAFSVVMAMMTSIFPTTTTIIKIVTTMEATTI